MEDTNAHAWTGHFPCCCFPAATASGNLQKQLIEFPLDPTSTTENLVPSGPHALMTQIMEMVKGLVWATKKPNHSVYRMGWCVHGHEQGISTKALPYLSLL